MAERDWTLLSLVLLVGGMSRAAVSAAGCPWDSQLQELQASCICASSLLGQLSVQCDAVDFPLLLRALEKLRGSVIIELLYLNNSTLPALENGVFKRLKMTNLQLSGCGIKSIGPGAFDGQEESLRSLYLQENKLEEVPVESLSRLRNLTTLDLSKNRLTEIPDGAFAGLHSLTTLKLADNNLTLGEEAFAGLEDTLKNLNLKGTRQKAVPGAVRGLGSLAFLDLAQNGLQELPDSGEAFEGLDSLTALNLERNVLQEVSGGSFTAVRTTLSSLSLLNNLLTQLPTAALATLTQLRVLDIGFNLLTELPKDGFLGNPSLTLLALDGNPLSTVPLEALLHLNGSLRGLSLGGRFLRCDCRLAWVAEWVRRGDLQVTSRERSPQFCGSPPRLKERTFYTIQPQELTCEDREDENEERIEGIGYVEEASNEGDLDPSNINKDSPATSGSGTSSVVATASSTTTTSVATTTSTTTTPTTTTTSTTPKPTTTTPTVASSPSRTNPTTSQRPIPTSPRQSGEVRRGSVVRSSPWPPPAAAPPGAAPPRPPPAAAPPGAKPPRPPPAAAPPRPPLVLRPEVLLRSAHRQDSSVVIQWDSTTSNILGFRVVYRLFGDKAFKQGPPLEPTEREFKIKNVPSQECIIVCVISLEEVNVSPETVPFSQCREVRTVSTAASNMDKITIAASAAICGTVVIAVIIFVAASRRRSRKLDTLSDHGGKMVGGLPVACCPASSPGALSSLATLNAFTSHKDWDTGSVYSNRSAVLSPRRGGGGGTGYHFAQPPHHLQGSMRRSYLEDEMRYGLKAPKSRSAADGQSQHSSSGRYLESSGVFSNGGGLVASRPELRQSRQSLAASERLSRVSYPTGRGRTERQHQTTGGNHQQHQTAPRPASRFSTSSHYCTGDTSDNWTDHDLDIYVPRNQTATRSGRLIPL